MSSLLADRGMATGAFKPTNGPTLSSVDPKHGQTALGGNEPVQASKHDHAPGDPHHGHHHAHNHDHDHGRRPSRAHGGPAGLSASATVAVRPSLLRFGLSTRLAVAGVLSIGVIALTASVLV